MLLYFFSDTLGVPYPIAAWLSGVGDMSYSIATSPVGILVAALFLIMGFYRLGIMYVAVLASLAGAALVEWRYEDWQYYSDQLQYYQMSQILTASLALCLSASLIGRRMGPSYM